MQLRRFRVIASLSAALFSLPLAAEQTLPPPLRIDPPSDVPVAVQILRWHMLDNDVSALMFRSMDSLFTTRTVAPSGDVWRLPRSDRALEFSYTWQDEMRAADAFLERTYTNALLIMKDGRIV